MPAREGGTVRGPALQRTGTRAASLVVALVASGLFVYLAYRNLSVWAAALRYPGEISEIEGRAMTEMYQLRLGVPIYAPASADWFDSANYGPLYYLLGSRLLQHPGYRNLRLLSMLSTLTCALVVGLLGWRISRNLLAAALAAVLMLDFALVTALAESCRCDMMALALATGGFYLAYRFRFDGRVLWACPLMMLGLGFKPIYLAAPAAVLTFLLMGRRYRAAAQFATGCGLGFAALLLFFAKVIYPGQALLLHLFKYNLLPFSWRRLGFYMGLFALTFLPVAILAAVYLWRTRDRLMGLYFAWAFVLAVGTVAKEGSSGLYFVEFGLVLCPVLAVGLVCWVQEKGIRDAILPLVLVVFYLLATAPGLPSVQPADFPNDAAIQRFLRQNFPPGTLGLSEYAGDLTRAGLTIPIADLYQYSWLRRQGEIPADPLVSQIERQRFGIILLRTDLTNPEAARESADLCWSEDLRHAIVDHYRLAEKFRAPLPDRSRTYYAWVPRRPAAIARTRSW